MTTLTPYDTGERLEPQPWSLDHADRYGLVDLDDDESSTVFTLVGKKRDDGSPSHLLSVETYSEDSVVEIDGNRVLVLDEDALAGLSALVELAQRGREDFQHQAETTRDYSEEDVRAADDAWSLAEQTIKKIRGARP
ncbi:hypothetical protein [Leucobacter chromiireducens]|uniref:hypothetical protein n=1 Tax=Leucobacter chromiireducens TaxID=283877 RepID=UPI000F6341B1|nr:hypothetical protein [Leucobacter chromiireducens]